MLRFLRYEKIPLDELDLFPGNANVGNVPAIVESLIENSQFRSLIVREVDGRHVVMAGNHTKLAMVEHGAQLCDRARRHAENPDDNPACGLCVDDQPFDGRPRCEIYECDDDDAIKVNVADNRIQEFGHRDDQLLADQLGTLEDLAGTGYDYHDYESITHRLLEGSYIDQQTAEVLATQEPVSAPEPGSQAPPDPPRVISRTVPLDAMFCCRYNSISLAAYEMGFLPGMISSKTDAWRKILDRNPGIRIGLMDNDWHDYDHAAHIAGVTEAKPKYATVRDVMTKAQCEAAGVEFFPVEQILDMAAEVAEHADHVIVIPKYDCLDKIPEEYVIGFSVPTSYGGTPMPASMLQGRRVHLLGGSWKNQRAFLEILGEDVVSLDNNHVLRICEFGNFSFPDGSTSRLANLDPRMPRTWQAAAILSLASIRDELNARYAAGITSAADEVPDVTEYVHDDQEDNEETE